MPKQPPRPSLNQLAAPLVAALLKDAVALRLGVARDASGATLIDAGMECRSRRSRHDRRSRRAALHGARQGRDDERGTRPGRGARRSLARATRPLSLS